MRILGINDCSHDAAISVIDNGEIVFAGHSERYNKEKNTFEISPQLLDEAFSEPPDLIAYFEKRSLKRFRKLLYGGINGEYKKLYKRLHDHAWPSEVQFHHHYSHAAAGYFTSVFDEATVVVIDAIGEFETATVWDAFGNQIIKRDSYKYPFSYGLFYSAFTKLVGLKPGTDEYVLMGMAAYGDPARYAGDVANMFPAWNQQTTTFHTGVENWPHEITCDQDKYDIAAAVQKIYEIRLVEFMRRVRAKSTSQNLVFMGGCALNCAANTKLLDIWEHVWIMPNPGDAGSSLGAALAAQNSHVAWRGPYLGHNIGDFYPTEEILATLFRDRIVAVASGRAEFGPRALGNRSLLADPRPADMKDRVNEVKHREPFRPFAPIVMEEHAHEYFDLDRPAPYMQYAVKAKHPHLMPAVVHEDGTSRVQTVNEKQHPGLYEVLDQFYRITGLPVLLNTSLNVRNQPMLNDEDDVLVWKNINPKVRIVS